MDWLWPDLLLLLGLIPLIVAIYIGILRRRRFTVRYSSLSLVKEAAPQRSRLRRHFPFILFVVALTNLVVALGRPVTPLAMLSGRTTIILTLDISSSMCMQDILPSRLEAAKSAALSFVKQPVTGTQVGVVVFAGFAELAQPPTTEPSLLENSIENLTTSTETAIGSAILRSLDAIAEVDQRVLPSKEIDEPATSLPEPPQRSKSSAGDYVPHIIVLLTDGVSNAGPPPLRAAQEAAERGVRIYPIGFGTSNSSSMDCWSSSGSDPYGVGFASQVGGGSSGTEPDETILKQIAQLTGGTYYSAASAAELQTVFRNLHNDIVKTNRPVEISVVFAAFGATLAMIALILSFLWHPLL